MEPIELRDLDAARRFVAEGLWLQRAVKPSAATVKPVLDWAMEIASSGHPLPPVGFVADVGHVALGADAEHRAKDAPHVPGWPPALGRTYEDHVLGKLYADWTFERASDALRRYQGKDRARGLAYLVTQLRTRAGFGGVMLPPAVIRGLLAANSDEVLGAAWDGRTCSTSSTPATSCSTTPATRTSSSAAAGRSCSSCSRTSRRRSSRTPA